MRLVQRISSLAHNPSARSQIWNTHPPCPRPGPSRPYSQSRPSLNNFLISNNSNFRTRFPSELRRARSFSTSSPTSRPDKSTSTPDFEALEFSSGDELFDRAVKRFRWNGVEFYLLGAVHHSVKSQEFAEKLMEMIKPDVVVVELPREERVSINYRQSFWMWYLKISGLDRIAHTNAPEMGFAVSKAQERGIKTIKADRDSIVSTARMINYLPVRFRVYTFVNSILNNILDSSKVMRAKIESYGYENLFKYAEEVKGDVFMDLPAMNWSMLFERNWFLIRGLKEGAKFSKSEQYVPRQTHPVVMGVFGAGHVYGVIEQWFLESQVDLEELNNVDPVSIRDSFEKWMKYRKVNATED